MGTLSYTVSMSLDGYAADINGSLDWSVPDEDLFAFHIERMSGVSTEILGRTTYELMKYWEQEPSDETWTELEHEFSQKWLEIDQFVASTTLTPAQIDEQHTQLLPHLTVEQIQQIAEQAQGEVEIFGPTTAGLAIRHGLVSDYRFFLVPVVLGAGLPALPFGPATRLHLKHQHTFANGVIYLHYTPGSE